MKPLPTSTLHFIRWIFRVGHWIFKAGIPAAVLLLALPVAAQTGSWEDRRDASWLPHQTGDTFHLIDTPAQLAQFAWLLNTSASDFEYHTFSISAPLDLSAHYWVPAGTNNATSFRGTLSARRDTFIDGLTITGTHDNASLFGILNTPATIQNLTLTNTLITAGRLNAAGITGTSFGTAIINCTVHGAITHAPSATSAQCGGIAGNNGGLIVNSVNHATITSTSTGNSTSTGGIAGNNGDILANSINHGAVTAAAGRTGGIAGRTDHILANCVNHAPVTSPAADTGALAGYNSSNVRNSFWSTANNINSGLPAIGDDNDDNPATGCSSFSSPSGLPAQSLNSYLDTLPWVGTYYSNSGYPYEVPLCHWAAAPAPGGYPALKPYFHGGNWADQPNRDTSWSFSTASGATNLIHTPAQLAQFAWLINDGTVFRSAVNLITADLELGAHLWTPAGTNASKAFNGTLTARPGLHISGLTIDDPTLPCAGLIGRINSTSSSYSNHLSHLTLTHASVNAGSYAAILVGHCSHPTTITHCSTHGTLNATGRFYAGGIAARAIIARSTITHCTNSATITSSNRYTGGIIGDFSSNTLSHTNTLAHCHNAGTITGANETGGIVGQCYYTLLTDCHNSAPVTGTDYTGGIAGIHSRHFLTHCTNTAPVHGADYTGGIAGQALNNQTITHCLNTAPVTGADYTGGITGYSYVNTLLAHSLNTADVTGVDFTGGIAGTTYETLLTHCTNSAPVTGDGSVGGITGYALTRAHVTRSANLPTATVNGTTGQIGGIAGLLDNDAILTRCVNHAPVACSRTSVNPFLVDGTGGIAGHINYGTLSHSANHGPVNGFTHTGGITGQATDESLVTHSTNTAPVTATSYYTGGITGLAASYTSGSTHILHCLNTGTVNGPTTISGDSHDTGGIAGYVASQSLLFNCHNTGFVTGRTNTGGVTGSNYGTNLNCSATCNIHTSENKTGGIAGYNSGHILNSAHYGYLVPIGGQYTGGIAGHNEGTLYNCFSGSIFQPQNATFYALLVGRLSRSTSRVFHCHWSDLRANIIGFYDSEATDAQVTDNSFHTYPQITIPLLNAQVASPLILPPADDLPYYLWGLGTNNYPSLLLPPPPDDPDPDPDPDPDHTLLSPIPVPHDWLDHYGLVTNNDFEAAATNTLHKGQPVWHDYLAGTDPTNTLHRLTAHIGITNDIPHIWWTPDLRGNLDFLPPRAYTIHGKTNLTDTTSWMTPTNSAHRFFKVSVRLMNE